MIELKKALKVKFTKDKVKNTVIVRPPTYKVEQELRTAYAVAYRKCIESGVATRSSMLELMRQEKIWTEEEEVRMQTLAMEASILEAGLMRSIEEGSDIESQKCVVLKLTEVRGRVYEMVAMKTLPLEQTAEEIANDIVIDRFISLSTYMDDGTLYFRSHEQFLENRDESQVKKIFNAVIDELSKDNIELLKKLPENQWLIDNKFMDGKSGDIDIRELIDVVDAPTIEQQED